MNEATFKELRDSAVSVFRCDPESIHGPGHWRNVEDAVLLMAPDTGADIEVGRLFAIFHDCCRLDDGSDLEHGPRAATFIHGLLGNKIRLTPAQAELLLYAVREHTAGRLSDDPTVGTCWDADRLDLGRVGIAPTAKYMSTPAGKEIAKLGSKYLYREKRNQTTQ